MSDNKSGYTPLQQRVWGFFSDQGDYLTTTEVNDIIDELILPCAKEDDWQPIETAPRDGTQILATPCFGTSNEPYQIWYDSTGKRWHGWRHSSIRITAEPTHWQPLPEPPKK